MIIGETQGFRRFPGRQLPLGAGFLVRELVDQLGEGLPVLSGEGLQEGDHRLQQLHGGLGDGVVFAEIEPDDDLREGLARVRSSVVMMRLLAGR